MSEWLYVGIVTMVDVLELLYVGIVELLHAPVFWQQQMVASA